MARRIIELSLGTSILAAAASALATHPGTADCRKGQLATRNRDKVCLLLEAENPHQRIRVSEAMKSQWLRKGSLGRGCAFERLHKGGFVNSLSHLLEILAR